MSQLELFDDVEQRAQVVAVVAVGRQHRRVPVRGDRSRLDRGHLLVDRLELLVQPETVHDELDFRDARARVLHVHHGEEHAHRVVVGESVTQQVHAVRVHRQYGDGAHGDNGGRERAPQRRFVRVHREVHVVVVHVSFVRAYRARARLVHDRDPGQRARDGHGPRKRGHDHRERRAVASGQHARDPLRVRVRVNARQQQRDGNR